MQSAPCAKGQGWGVLPSRPPQPGQLVKGYGGGGETGKGLVKTEWVLGGEPDREQKGAQDLTGWTMAPPPGKSPKRDSRQEPQIRGMVGSREHHVGNVLLVEARAQQPAVEDTVGRVWAGSGAQEVASHQVSPAGTPS